MPVTYTNRKGITYYLCQTTTKTGKPRYTFARESKGQPVEEIPDGWEISESVNGVVSLVKQRPQLIQPGELAAVEAAIRHHPKSRNYRTAIKSNAITVYEYLGPDVDCPTSALRSAG